MARFESVAKKCRATWSARIYRWLLFVSAVSSGSLADRLESRDAVFVNFHRRYNVSKVAVLRNDGGYLPPPAVALPPPPDLALPEVIDNRVRSVIKATNETRSYPNALYLDERDFARVLTPKGSSDARYLGSSIGLQQQQALQHHHRHRLAFPQGKHSRPTATQLPPLVETPTTSSFANQISVEEMSCQNAGNELFFRASIKVPRGSAPPVVDNAIGEACRAIAVGDSYRVNFERDQFWNCGIVDCSTDGNQSYCLDLRFPMISGLRLKDDYGVTLRCKTQDRIAYRTKRINVKTLEAKARNVPNVLNGGSTSALDMDVGLFRKTYGSESTFDTRIQPGGTVVLGEEILLRVLINGDDGWRHSKIGQVTVHYVESKQQQKIVNSLWILDKDGCLNADVREICPREQYMASSLESYLIFQAFMFDGMRETDEIFLTVKATACLEAADCVLDCPAGHVRRARSVPDRNGTVEWQDDIALRVVLPRYELRASRNYYLAILLPATTLIALIALLWFVGATFRRKTTKS